ncbi:hypothetical protein [Streptomyces sp. CA-106131]|uniref:hypothetical protein n=1 Tax=Streptomyces sp. CA-106131 TaxID=3240045 RepID=UPI003D89C859
MPDTRLLQPLILRGASSRNRVMASPMCTYAAADDGFATDFHLAYLHLREPELAELADQGERPMTRYLNDSQAMIE